MSKGLWTKNERIGNGWRRKSDLHRRSLRALRGIVVSESRDLVLHEGQRGVQLV
jgi:hypothetical protein